MPERKKLNIVNGSLTGLKTLILVLVLLIWMFGDSTVAGWAESNPYILVRPVNDWVDGFYWTGPEVTLTIEDPLTHEVYTETQAVNESGDFMFKLGDYFDIQPGHFVVVTDGVTTK